MGGLMAALAGVALLLAAQTAAAQGRPDYEIEAFRVLLVVRPDSSLLVQETITVAFRGSHQGISRTIPLTNPRLGTDHRLRIDQIQVLDEQRTPLRAEVSHPSGLLRIKAWVPEARDAARTVVILYRVRRALLSFDGHDELYWNVTGNEWAAPIREAEALVELPASVPVEAVRTVAYTGPLGAVGRDWETDRVGPMLRVRTTQPLRMREGLTVAVGWPSGHVTFPSRGQEIGWLLTDQAWFGLPFVVLVACLFVWSRTGRDPLRTRSIKPEYEPPPGLRPGEMGTLVDERVRPRDIVATVVDLAVRGYVHIERVAGGSDYQITLARRWLGDPDLEPFEVVVLAQIFGDAAMIQARRLSELRRDSGAVVRPIHNQLYRDLVSARCFFASPETVRTVWRLIGFGVAAVVFTLFQVEVASFQLLLAGVTSGLIVAAFARAMPRKTYRGAVLAQRVRGFQEFLSRAEKDRLQRLPPETLHRWLPHAIALGVEEAWLAGFTGLSVAAPTWYLSDRPFSIDTYGDDLRHLRQEAEAAWLSAPRGRGGAGGSGVFGGSSGGGSSGGGFGGGGGGTF